MNRKRRTKIFIDYANKEVIDMSNEIKGKYDVEIIQEPHEGLTMIKVRETAKNTLFYLGEMLITETKVRINDSVGVGVVKGTNPDLSLSLAIADAAYKEDIEELGKWNEIFLDCEKKGKEKLKEKRSILARTKVDFEMMDM